MISEALGLLLGQIAVLSMQRFFKALPRSWIQKYVHPAIRHFLRCDLPADTIHYNRTQAEAICFPTVPLTCKKLRKKTEIIIDSINQALLKLHNYDKQLIRFEETFAGSAIVLVIIFGILLTVLLWLQRLSYVSPNGTSQNYKRSEPKYDRSKKTETDQETLEPKSPTTVKFTSNLDNLGEEAKNSQNKSFMKSEMNSFNNSVNFTAQSMEKRIDSLNKFRTTAFDRNEQVDRMKEIVNQNERRNRIVVFNMSSRHYQKTCKTNQSGSSGYYNKHRSRTFGEVRRQRYIPILLFLSDEPMNEDTSHPPVVVRPKETAKLRKRRHGGIS